MPPPPTTAKSTAKSPRQTVTANTAKTPYRVGVWRWRLTVAVLGKNSEIKSGGGLTTIRNKLAKIEKQAQRPTQLTAKQHREPNAQTNNRT